MFCLAIIFWFIKICLAQVADNCYKKATNSSEYCLSCAEGFYSLNETAFANVPFLSNDCIRKKQTPLELVIFVSDSTCSSSGSCNGSQEYPLDSLINALDLVNNQTRMYSQATVQIYLLGIEIFILEKELKTGTKAYFRRSPIVLSILPVYCSFLNITGCKKEGETVTINIKSNQIIFFISNFLSLRGIVFKGADMPLETANSSTCFSEKKTCCVDGNKEKIPNTEFSLCNSSLNQTKLFNNSVHSFGLFTTETLSNKNSLTGDLILPQVWIEDCKIMSVSTLFPTNSPRFSSLIQLKGLFANITLKNSLLINCSLAEGVLRQDITEEISNVSTAFQAQTSVSNISIYNYKRIYIKEVPYCVICIDKFGGDITVSSVFLNLTSSSKITFLTFNYVNSIITILNILYSDNKDFNLLSCNFCESINIMGLTLIRSTLNLNDSLIEIKNSLNVFLNMVAFNLFNFSKTTMKPFAIVITNAQSLVLQNFQIEKTSNFTLRFEYSLVKFQNFTIKNISTNFKLLSLLSCSAIFENFSWNNIDLRINDYCLVSMNSGVSDSSFKLTVVNSIFSNLGFTNDDKYDGIFEWPLFTKNDIMSMNGISIFNCTRNSSAKLIIFFKDKAFSEIYMENIDFSLHEIKKSSLLLSLDDVTVINLKNISFRRNNPNYYLILIQCSNCKIYISNLKIDVVIFNLASFWFNNFGENGSGIFENFTFTNINQIASPSSGSQIYYSFYYGLISFYGFNNCLLINWIISSQTYKFIPSRLLDLQNNINITLKNFSLTLSESSTNRAEAHILASIFNSIIIIDGLTAKNFFCQRTLLGNIQYDGGLISFFDSDSFLRDFNSKAQVYLSNIYVENCKFCKNGVIGIIKIGEVVVRNINISRAENINGGAISIYYGTNILIENLNVSGTLASQYGGVIFSLGSINLLIKNVLINNVSAQNGGTIYLREVKNATLQNFHGMFSQALFDGGVIYAIYSNIMVKGGQILLFTANRDGGWTFIRGGNFQVSGGFTGKMGSAEKGGLVFAYEVGELVFKDLAVNNVTAKIKGICIILDDCSNMEANNMTISELGSNSGFGNLHFTVKFKSANYLLKDILCIRINILSSALIYFVNELNFKMSLKVGLSNIKISYGSGSVAFIQSSSLSQQHLFIFQNITVFNFNENISTVETTDNILEKAFTFQSSFLLLKNLNFSSVFFKSQLMAFLSSEFTFDTFNFQSEANFLSADQKACFIFYIINSTSRLLKIFLLVKETTNIALIFSESSSIVLENGILSDCRTNKTSCIEVKKSFARISYFIFNRNKGFIAGVLNSLDSSIIFENSNFTSNSALKPTTLGLAINNIAIFGKKENKVSVIRNCLFLDNIAGTSVLINESSLNISFCNFLAFSKQDFNLPVKALWGFSSDVEIIWSNFSNFISKNGGTLKIEHETKITNKKDAKHFSLKYSTISNSVSDLGGAFSLFGLLNIEIVNNIFSFNSAIKNQYQEYGNFGVGFFICLACSNTSFNLFDNYFFNNQASNGIATIFSNFYIETNRGAYEFVDSNYYTNNSDGISYQGNLSFLPLKVKYFIKAPNYETNNSQFKCKSNKSFDFLADEINNKSTLCIRSGQSFDLVFLILDQLEQKFLIEIDSNAVITDTKINELNYFQITNQESFLEEAGFLFNNLLIKAELDKEFQLQLAIILKSNYIYSDYRLFITIEPKRLIFFSMPCEIGDIIIIGDSSCLKCPYGKFSLVDPMKKDNNTYVGINTRCLDCLDNAVCPGGSELIPKVGYWRYSNTSTLIIECLSKFSCLGYNDGELNQEEIVHGKCEDHSSGPLCYTCDPGYGRFSKKGVCRICSSEIESYIKLAIIILMFLYYSLIQIKLTFKISRTSTAGILLKIIVTHFQQLSLISLVDLGWTPDFTAFFFLQDIFSFITEDFLPLECLLQNFGYNIYIQKVLATIIYPIALSMLIIFGWIAFLLLFHRKSSPINNRRSPIKITKVAFFIVIVLLFPEVINKCLSLFTCLTIDDSGTTTLLLYSPDIVCWSEAHVKYLELAAVPGLITWGLIAPFIIGVILIKNKKQIQAIIEDGSQVSSIVKVNPNPIKKLEGVENALMLKFLFKGYSSKYYYFELLVFLKKFILISIGCVSDLFPSELRGVILLIIISFLMLFQIRCQPFESKNLNRLEFFSLLTIFLTANVGISLFSSDFRVIAVGLLAFVILIHSLFILYWLYLFVSELVLRNRILNFFEYLRPGKRSKLKSTVSPLKMNFQPN